MAIQISGSTVIHDSQDVQVSGVVTATSFHGDASQLTNLPAAGSSLQATASGTLADGSTVVVNTDGTVSAIAQIDGWISLLGDIYSDSNSSVAVDSSGNIYVGGDVYSASSRGDFSIVKYNSSGTVQWQRKLGNSSAVDDYCHGIAVDSSNNVYAVGTTLSAGAGNRDFLIVKYNSSGTIQWQRTLGGTNNDTPYSIAVDGSGNVYITGFTLSAGSGSADCIIAKYNSSGTIQWQRTLGGTSNDYGSGIAVDGSGNVYITGYTESAGAGHYDCIIAKYNSSGVIQWQRTLGDADRDLGRKLTVDSSGNFYVVGSEDKGSGQYDILIVKYNTSGTIQWQRTLGGTATEDSEGVALDSSGNVYITGYTSSSGAGSDDILIAKYNASGTIQWQRTLGSTGLERPKGIAHDGSGNIYIAGYSDIANSPFADKMLVKLSDDGSGTGTYGNFTYAASSLTDASTSLTDSASSLTDSASSLTDAASSLTDSASNMTSSTTSMQSTNLTAENYIGISNGAYTNGQTATVQLIGSVDDAQSGLTPGQKYYVQVDGSLSTTADTPSVFAGKAISSTKLAIKG